MSLPDQSRKVGSKWDIVMRQLKESHRKLINKNCFSNEIELMQSLNKSKEIKSFMFNYLDDLTPVIKKCSKLSEEIRSEGNKIYKQNNTNSNLFDSCFLYSLALKCSYNNSDLAFAHGNRAAALIKLGFYTVATDDCLEAIKLEHPDKFKIYERLCSLSLSNVKNMRKNVSGLEKYLKKGSKQSKEIVQKYKTRLKAMEKEIHVDQEKNIKEDCVEAEMKVKQ
jgi:hypothetical protein